MRDAKMRGEDKSEKMVWAREWNNMKREYIVLNRKKYRGMVGGPRSDYKTLLEQLQKHENDLEDKQKEELNMLFHVIKYIKVDTQELKPIIKNMRPNEKSLTNLRKRVLDCETLIKNFKYKERERWEELETEDDLLQKEINILAGKVDAMEKERKAKQPHRPIPKVESKVKKMIESKGEMGEKREAETDEAEKLKLEMKSADYRIEQLGGINLGWDPEDHQDFLKLRTRHNNKIQSVAFISNALKLLPIKNQQDIELHVEYITEYFELTELKKTLLQKYKQLKTEEKHKLHSEIEKAAILQERPKKNPLDVKRQQELNKKNTAKKLEEWKLKKEKDLEIKNKEIEYKIDMKNRRKEEKLEREREEKQQMLEEYRELKALEEMKKDVEDLRDKSSQSKVTKEQIERVKNREAQSYQKRISNIENKKNQKFRREEIQHNLLKGTSKKYKSVESKLSHQTEAQKCKQREKFDPKMGGKDALTFGGNLISGTARAVPDWRKGI